ncbi:MAG: polysaccharide biosynthesis/export family protein [Acidobacteria bacterium]|nr:polysaccharide biosynthesis/export family protein [Acidobacteriota bacterium]
MKLVPTLIVVFCMFVSDTALGQTSDVTDPEFPLNYRSMATISSNRAKRQHYFQRLPGIAPDYQLGPGDLLTIDVTGNKALKRTVNISNSGNISFPFIGELRVEDLTAEELEVEIARRLKDQRLMKNPEVLVYIESYAAKPISVVGEVDCPGEYVMTQRLTIMDAILIAGGLDITASRYGYLHRRIAQDKGAEKSRIGEPIGRKPILNILSDGNAQQPEIMKSPEIASPGTEVIKIDLQPAKEGGVIAPNIPLRAGDVLVVPRRNIRVFYVIGEVEKPGAYEIDSEASLPASQAISYAGGPAKTAKMADGILVRQKENGERQESKVDYSAILKGKQKDFEVLSNDVIFIPGSKAKTLGYGLLGILPETIPYSVQDSSWR